MNFAEMIGHTLDGKYKIERELGRGGMGTVYLATHLGTERPVAVKVIAPQFMERPEFVERFRREARAAGRLRHPNVVDVTDFGFDETEEGRVAYLVMEYLDGCTLGEILEEEKNLPIGWTLDILEQVCSAVQEAHEQGIIHRDLKPDNIWLEPNQRGGYTVKVLDFGIAKLETQSNGGTGEHDIHITAAPTYVGAGRETIADGINDPTLHDSASPTAVSGTGTVSGANSTLAGGEAATLIQPALTGTADDKAAVTDQEKVGTRLIDKDAANADIPREKHSSENTLATKALTRVGAVLGTPLYMSPEQCRGEKLDARSDVYSLGVIAYQMLSGDPPFRGDFTSVMESHRLVPPPPLAVKDVRRKLKREIMSALEKDPDNRPQSAEAFATRLRSRSEGIFGLLRRAGMIYTEHITKFIGLSALFHLPMMFFTLLLIVLNFMKIGGTLDSGIADVLIGIMAVSLSIVSAFCAYLIIGTITWVVTQSFAVPLRPIRMRLALKEARKKWKSFAGTGVITTILSLIVGVVTCGIGFLVTSVLWTLVGPVVMMENLKGKAALKRSKDLVKRSLVTATAAVAIMFLIPAVAAGTISFVVNITDKALSDEAAKVDIVNGDAPAETVAPEPTPDRPKVEISIPGNRTVRIKDNGTDMRSNIRQAVRDSLLQLLLLPIQILVTSITAIIVALLYLKTRQAGGENLQDLLAGFEEADKPRTKWQERVQQRLLQSGRNSSGSSRH